MGNCRNFIELNHSCAFLTLFMTDLFLLLMLHGFYDTLYFITTACAFIDTYLINDVYS